MNSEQLLRSHPRLRELDSVRELLSALPEEVIHSFSGVETYPALRAERFATRLQERAARRLELHGCLEIADGGAFGGLIRDSGSTWSLVAELGAICHRESLAMVVDKKDLTVLREVLLLDETQITRMIDESSSRPERVVKVKKLASTPQALAEGVLNEGLLCWRSWLAGRSRPTARYLWVMTPEALRDRAKSMVMPGLRERSARARMVGAVLARWRRETE